MTGPSVRPARLTLAAVLAMVLLATVPVTASAATRTVTLGAQTFSPARLPLARGTRVTWVNPSPAHGGFLAHDVTSTAPAGYFVSGPSGGLAPGERFSSTFTSAGRFSYLCTVHAPMKGSVSVPVSVAKLSGPVRFSVTVASAKAVGPWRNEVQVLRPGSATWSTLRTTRATGVVLAPSRHGTYRFRSRVIDPGSGAASGWSAALAATF